MEDYKFNKLSKVFFALFALVMFALTIWGTNPYLNLAVVAISFFVTTLAVAWSEERIHKA